METSIVQRHLSNRQACTCFRFVQSNVLRIVVRLYVYWLCLYSHTWIVPAAYIERKIMRCVLPRTPAAVISNQFSPNSKYVTKNTYWHKPVYWNIFVFCNMSELSNGNHLINVLGKASMLWGYSILTTWLTNWRIWVMVRRNCMAMSQRVSRSQFAFA